MDTERSREAGAGNRQAFTLAELLVVLTLGALVLGLITAIGVRLQRQMTNEGTRLSVGEQLAAGAELLPIDLRSASPEAGDIPEATDSSLQLRATISNGIVCGGGGTSLIASSFLGAGKRAITLTAQDGDTVWLMADSDSLERWQPVRVRSARRLGGSCGAVNDVQSAELFDLSQLWALDLYDTTVASVGSVIRLTRPVRYSFYRAGDGNWYLGLRSWNASALQFNAVQPLSGPYARPAGGSGTRFQYYDSDGRPITPSSSTTGQIARIEALLVGDPPETTGTLGSDSVRVVVAVRNRG